MADSPRTDISTDAETDERSKRYERGLVVVPAASDSSDRSKENKDQKVGTYVRELRSHTLPKI